MLSNKRDTIYALATIYGKSGLGVIRISGSKAKNIIDFFKLNLKLAPRKMEIVKLYHPNENYFLDKCLIVFFESPHSFTGEDIIELHIHGSKAIIKNLLLLLSKIPNFRLAEPGEFAKRSFLNGKMTITEAEGLADMIEAETIIQHKQAARQFSGELENLYERWRKSILKINAFIEAYIDFPEEDIPANLTEDLHNKIRKLQQEIITHLDDNQRGERLREGLYAIIFGTANVGKSSLLNYLSRKDAAIISDIAGTTRDIIEVNLDIGGYPLTLADSAGLRETDDIIEKEGVKKAIKIISRADIKIAIFDYHYLKNLDNITLENIDKNTIIIINKFDDNSLPKPENFLIKDIEPIYISIKNKLNLDLLINKIKIKLDENFGEQESPLLTRARYRENLSNSVKYLEEFFLENAIELAAENLRLAAESIGKITGKIEVDEILGEIFSNFCIGK